MKILNGLLFEVQRTEDKFLVVFYVTRFFLWILCKKEKKFYHKNLDSVSREGPSKEVSERQTFLTSEFKFTLKLPYGTKTELNYINGTCSHSNTPEGICKLSFCIFTQTWHCYSVLY